jgi:hypothetical protein
MIRGSSFNTKIEHCRLQQIERMLHMAEQGLEKPIEKELKWMFIEEYISMPAVSYYDVSSCVLLCHH